MMNAREIKEWFQRHKDGYELEIPKGSDNELKELSTDTEIERVAGLCTASVQLGWTKTGNVPTVLDAIVFALQVGFVLGEKAAEEQQLEKMAQL